MHNTMLLVAVFDSFLLGEGWESEQDNPGVEDSLLESVARMDSLLLELIALLLVA